MSDVNLNLIQPYQAFFQLYSFFPVVPLLFYLFRCFILEYFFPVYFFFPFRSSSMLARSSFTCPDVVSSVICTCSLLSQPEFLFTCCSFSVIQLCHPLCFFSSSCDSTYLAGLHCIFLCLLSLGSHHLEA